MDIKTYLQSMPQSERAAFAGRVGSTAGHLQNVSYGYRTCAEKLAIAIERHSRGAVTCEELRPDVDWQYLRGTAAPKRAARSA